MGTFYQGLPGTVLGRRRRRASLCEEVWGLEEVGPGEGPALRGLDRGACSEQGGDFRSTHRRDARELLGRQAGPHRGHLDPGVGQRQAEQGWGPRTSWT